ncbi:MAG TPA: hypothetical protein VIS48_07575 [Candidatus Kryptonia bacterium]
MGITDTSDHISVQEKIKHYEGIVSHYTKKYSVTYEEFSKSIAGKAMTAEIEDDLLDWKEALLMLGIYERISGGFG